MFNSTQDEVIIDEACSNTNLMSFSKPNRLQLNCNMNSPLATSPQRFKTFVDLQYPADSFDGMCLDGFVLSW